MAGLVNARIVKRNVLAHTSDVHRPSTAELETGGLEPLTVNGSLLTINFLQSKPHVIKQRSGGIEWA